MIAVLTEYLHSQQQHALTLDVTAGMLLLTLLEEQRSFYQLHQLVQSADLSEARKMLRGKAYDSGDFLQQTGCSLRGVCEQSGSHVHKSSSLSSSSEDPCA